MSRDLKRITASTSPDLRPPAWVRRQTRLTRVAWLLLVGLLVWASFGTELSVQRLIGGLGDGWRYIVGIPGVPASGFFPPNFSRWQLYLEQMLLTIKMAIWGTTLAFILAVPLSWLAADNTSPHPLVYQATRRLFDVMRGLNEFILALIFVAAIGLGPFPGILALAIHTAGILGKLFSEGIEAVDKGQLEAIQATGAKHLQVFTHAIWPQIVPHVVSMTLYYFESNVRAATVLGIVGAGGIGFYITEAIRGFDNKAASAILIIILMSVFMVDFLSAKLRKWVT